MSRACILGVIPARLGSTRLPRKVLREIAGRPMLQWVYEAVRRCPELDDVVIATDADEVLDLCRKHGWPGMMTDVTLASGSDRVHAVAQMYPAEIYVNVQADEPLVRPEHLAALLRPFEDAAVQVSTLRVRCTAENADDPNTVKVVTAEDGRALYFSRARIPYDRDGGGVAVWKHLGLYAYRAEALRQFCGWKPSPLELAEKLEQLRFLENNIAVHVAETTIDTIGVDTEGDLSRVEQALRAQRL